MNATRSVFPLGRRVSIATIFFALLSCDVASSFSMNNKNKPPTPLMKPSESTTSSVSPSFVANLQRAATSAAAAFLVLAATSADHLAPPANAFEGARTVGEVTGSGLVFKDTLVIESFDDPKVKGISLYISNFQRPLAERLQKDFFSDPSFASVSCAKTGPVQIADNIAKGKGGEEVFEESKSLLFKTLRVQRIYDQEKKVVIYVSFNTRLDKNSDSNKSRFKSSTCAISVE